MRAATNHRKRVKAELIKAGVTKYGLLKLEARHLPEIIHEGEYVEAVAYGLSGNYSAMLVATDRRLIFLDCKPFYTISDEITYEMVAGIGHNVQGRFAAVTLHTRLGDYAIRFVNHRAAEKFVHYIEGRRLERLTEVPAKETLPASKPPAIAALLDEDDIAFLHAHHTAVLSSINRIGNVSGAVVHYFVDANNTVYILTKSDTQKAHNILVHPGVALTIYDAARLQTLQLQGTAEIEPDQGVKDFVFSQMTQPHQYGDVVDLPPVTKLHGGSFIVFRITLASANFSDYRSV